MYSTYAGEDVEALLTQSEIMAAALLKEHGLVPVLQDGDASVAVQSLLSDATKLLDQLEDATHEIERSHNTKMVLKLERARHSVQTNRMHLQSEFDSAKQKRDLLNTVAIYLREQAMDVHADGGGTCEATKTNNAREAESKFRTWYEVKHSLVATTNSDAHARVDGQQCTLHLAQAPLLPAPAITGLAGSDSLKNRLVQTCNVINGFQNLHTKSAKMLEEMVMTLKHLSDPLVDLSEGEQMLATSVQSMQDAQRTCFELFPRIVSDLKALR